MDNLQQLLLSLTDLEKKRFSADIKKFQTQKFTSKNDEAVKRHFFQEKIIESLTTNFLIEHHEHIQIYYESYMLYSKGLDVVASKRLRKAIEIAESIEDFNKLYLMYQLEMNLGLQQKDKLLTGIVSAAAIKKQKCIDNMNLYSKYEQINMYLREQYITNGFVLNEEIRSYFKQHIENDVFQDIPDTYPILVKNLILKIRYLYFLFMDEQEKAFAANEDMLKLIEKNIGIFSNDDYCTALYNICYMSLNLEMEDKYLSYFAKIDINVFEKENLRVKHYFNKLLLTSSYCLSFKKYKEGLKYFDTEVSRALQEFKDNLDIPTRIALNSEYAFICFHNKDFDRAQEYINATFKLARPGFRDDVIAVLKILEIAICYHLGLSSLLVSKCSSYIKNFPQAYQAQYNEFHLIEFMIKVNKDLLNEEKMKAHFAGLQPLIKAEDDNNWTHYNHAFNLYEWVQDCCQEMELVKH